MKIIHVDLAKYFIQNTGYMNIIHVDLAKYFFQNTGYIILGPITN